MNDPLLETDSNSSSLNNKNECYTNRKSILKICVWLLCIGIIATTVSLLIGIRTSTPSFNIIVGGKTQLFTDISNVSFDIVRNFSNKLNSKDFRCGVTVFDSTLVFEENLRRPNDDLSRRSNSLSRTILRTLKRQRIDIMSISAPKVWNGPSGVAMTRHYSNSESIQTVGGGVLSDAIDGEFVYADRMTSDVERIEGRYVVFFSILSGQRGEMRALRRIAGLNVLELDPNTEQPNKTDASLILESIRDIRRRIDSHIPIIVLQYNEYWNSTTTIDQLYSRQSPLVDEIPEWYRNWTTELIDAGVNIIMTYGNPSFNGVYKHPSGALIFYGIGSLYLQPDPKWKPGFQHSLYGDRAFESIVVELSFQGTTMQLDKIRVSGFRLGINVSEGIPIMSDSTVLNRFVEMSKKLGTRVVIDNGVAIIH